MSYMVEVIVEGERWENGVRLATREEAGRHTQWVVVNWGQTPVEIRIVESADPANCCIVNERGHFQRLVEPAVLLHPEIGMWREVGVAPAPLTD
jgi:hypothetical protein